MPDEASTEVAFLKSVELLFPMFVGTALEVLFIAMSRSTEEEEEGAGFDIGTRLLDTVSSTVLKFLACVRLECKEGGKVLVTMIRLVPTKPT